jgi:NAD(P)-dependent dehydrogenase (short-subunit alcohol dehydrogenase family)
MTVPGSGRGRVLVVTGGSRGIGAKTARLAADAGYRVALTYRTNRAAAEAIVERIVADRGEAIALAVDVAVESEVEQLFRDVDTRLGRIWALVNNAGILERQMRVDELDAARIARVFATNVSGTIVCAREAVRRMSARHGGPGGAIVNVSSMAAVIGAPHEYVDYAASKGAVDSFTRGLAKEVAEEGIRVNAVRPGVIYTDLHTSGGEPGRVDRVKAAVPMKRGGQPEEVARAILWLLSDDASYVTGACLDVSGGR